MSIERDNKYCKQVTQTVQAYIENLPPVQLERLCRGQSVWIYEKDVANRVVTEASFRLLGQLDGLTEQSGQQLGAALLFTVDARDVFQFEGETEADEEGFEMQAEPALPPFSRAEALALLSESYPMIEDRVGDILESLERTE